MEFKLETPITNEDFMNCDRIKIVTYRTTNKKMYMDTISYEILPIQNGILKNIDIISESVGNIVPFNNDVNVYMYEMNSCGHRSYKNVDKNDKIVVDSLKNINEHIKNLIDEEKNDVHKVFMYK